MNPVSGPFPDGPTPLADRPIVITHRIWLEIVAEAWRVYPLEACGVLLGRSVADPIHSFVAIPNAADSSRVFTLDPLAFDKADRSAEKTGLQVVGVVHSHTHTVAYPSPTDRAEMASPMIPSDWHWAILSLGWGLPELRSFRVWEKSPIGIAEETVVLAN